MIIKLSYLSLITLKKIDTKTNIYNQGLFHGTQRWHFENRETNHSSTLTVFNSKMTDVTSGIETAYPSGAPEFTPVFLWGSCCSILVFSV